MHWRPSGNQQRAITLRSDPVEVIVRRPLNCESKLGSEATLAVAHPETVLDSTSPLVKPLDTKELLRQIDALLAQHEYRKLANRAGCKY